MSFSFFDWFNFVLVRHFDVKLALDNWRDFLHLLNNLNAAQHHLKQKLKIIERDTLECVDIGATLETLKRQNLLNLKREGNTESAKRRCLRWTHSHWATPLHSKLEKKKWYDRERAAFVRSFVRSFVHSLVERSDQFKKFLNQCFLFSLQTLDLRTPTTTSSTSQMHASSSSMWKYEAKLIIYFLLRCALVSPSYSVSLFSTKIIAAKTNRFREGQLPLL